MAIEYQTRVEIPRSLNILRTSTDDPVRHIRDELRVAFPFKPTASTVAELCEHLAAFKAQGYQDGLFSQRLDLHSSHGDVTYSLYAEMPKPDAPDGLRPETFAYLSVSIPVEPGVDSRYTDAATQKELNAIMIARVDRLNDMLSGLSSALYAAMYKNST